MDEGVSMRVWTRVVCGGVDEGVPVRVWMRVCQ